MIPLPLLVLSADTAPASAAWLGVTILSVLLVALLSGSWIAYQVSVRRCRRWATEVAQAARTRDLEAILRLSDHSRVPRWATALGGLLTEFHAGIQRECEAAEIAIEEAHVKRDEHLCAPFAMLVVDAGGSVLTANSRALELLDDPRLLGKSLDEVMAPMEEGASEELEFLADVLGKNASSAELHSFVRENGEHTTILRLIETVRWEQGEPIEAACALIDLGQLLEARGTTADTSTLADDTITRLVRNVGHEFNDLLTAILGHASLLRRRSGRDERALLEVEGIEAAGGQARLLAHQLMVLDQSSDSEDETPRAVDLPPPALPSSVKPDRVCLVDDESGVRRLLASLLESGGYDVLQASSADEALQLFETETAPIDLLVTDVKMPIMRGDQLFEVLREEHEDLRVLFFSAALEGDLFQANPARPLDFMQKPFSPRDLLAKVKEILARDPSEHRGRRPVG